MLATIIEIALAALVLVGIINEDKLIAWERRTIDKVLDFFAWCCAQAIIAYRKIKRAACSDFGRKLQATSKATTYSGHSNSNTAAEICQIKE